MGKIGTNRDLKKMYENKTFLWDLYFRISRKIITFLDFIKLFKDEKENIIDKIVNNCNEFCRKNSPKFDKIELSPKRNILTPTFFSRHLGPGAKHFILYEYDWPGNSRELYNTILKSLAHNVFQVVIL